MCVFFPPDLLHRETVNRIHLPPTSNTTPHGAFYVGSAKDPVMRYIYKGAFIPTRSFFIVTCVTFFFRFFFFYQQLFIYFNSTPSVLKQDIHMYIHTRIYTCINIHIRIYVYIQTGNNAGKKKKLKSDFS